MKAWLSVSLSLGASSSPMGQLQPLDDKNLTNNQNYCDCSPLKPPAQQPQVMHSYGIHVLRCLFQDVPRLLKTIVNGRVSCGDVQTSAGLGDDWENSNLGVYWGDKGHVIDN